MTQTLQGFPGMTDAFRDFVQIVRLYTRDHPEVNRLTAGVESTDRQIAWAILDALSDFNGTPPLLGNFTVDSFAQMGQLALLTRMTVCSLIESVGLLQTRNQINYSNGGITVGVNDKTPLLMSWLQTFRATVDQKVLKLKVAINIGNLLNTAYSGVHSELWSINGTYISFLLNSAHALATPCKWPTVARSRKSKSP